MKLGQTNFDSEAYAADDARAKDAGKVFLTSKGFSVTENPDSADSGWGFKCPDLIASKDGKPDIYFEAEVSNNWDVSNSDATGRPKHWRSFYNWHRKEEQRAVPDIKIGEKLFWMMERGDLKVAVLCPSDAKLIKPNVANNPRFGKSANIKPREVFYEYSLDDCFFADFETGSVVKFKESIK